MGNIATNDLPTLATFTMEMTVLPLMVSMWFYSDSQMSWALATALVLTFEVGVSFCFDIHSPFSTLVGADLADGLRVLGVLVILCPIYSLIGSFIMWFLDGEEVLPIYAIFPMSVKRFVTRTPKGTSNGDANERVYKVTGLNRWGMVNLPKPYMHVLVTSIIFAITVGIPFIIYAFFMDDQGSNNSIALTCGIIIPLVGLVIAFIYWFYWRDPYVWGPCVKNLKLMGNRYAARDDKQIIKRHTKESNMRVYKTVIMLAVMQLISFVVLAGVRFGVKDVDWSWTVAAILAAVIVVVALVSYFALYIFRGKEEKKISVYNAEGAEVAPEDDEDDVELDVDMTKEPVTSVVVDNGESSTAQRMFQSNQQNLTHRLMSSGVMSSPV